MRRAAGTESDLHGNAPDKASTALLLIDVINDLEWPGGEQILGAALRMAEAIAALKRRARAANVPCVYVNDNFGRWKSDFRAQVEHCLRDGVRGGVVVRKVLPTDEDYFVLKPKHSGFYSTTLDILLRHLQSRSLIMTGIAGNNCVLFTANDAYMRDYRLLVPRDCVVSNSEEQNRLALAQMASVLKADTRPSHDLDMVALASGRSRSSDEEG
jgi:nicotinamidase-related amidase